MSDTMGVKFDTSRFLTKALEATEGMDAPEQASFLLEHLTVSCHRGPHDTWTAARERAAKLAGIPPSMAKRIWQRWQTMNDVSGRILVKLIKAYDEICEHNEAAAEANRAERLTLEAKNAAFVEEPGQQVRGMGPFARGAGQR